MESAITALKAKNIRVTSQRLAVYTLLYKKPGHLNAEEIYEQIKQVNPAVSLATVYTILDLFKAKGLVHEIHIHFDKSCFEARTEAHHHFLCKNCKKVFDVDMEFCSVLKKMKVNGHCIEAMQGYFYGICKKCKKA